MLLMIACLVLPDFIGTVFSSSFVGIRTDKVLLQPISRIWNAPASLLVTSIFGGLILANSPEAIPEFLSFKIVY